jgi:hypothetical protein
MRRNLLCCVLLLVGCGSTRYVHLPDGSRGRMVGCSGAEQDWGDCMNRAHRICDGAYRIVERYTERDRAVVAAHAHDPQTWSNSRDRKMLIACAP